MTGAALTWFEEQESRLVTIRGAHLKMIREFGSLGLLDKPGHHGLRKQRAVWAILKQSGSSIPLRISLQKMAGCCSHTVGRVFKKMNITILRKEEQPHIKANGYVCPFESRTLVSRDPHGV